MTKMLLALSIFVSMNAMADGKHAFAGSDTLAGVIDDAITAAGLTSQLQYTAGGSGTGEKNLVAGVQGIAPMSREFNPQLAQQLNAQGVNLVPHVIGLDAVTMFVNSKNATPSLDIPTIARIYSCEFTKWEQVPGSKVSGAIKAYRRDDASGTTDAFKAFTGVKTFGACVVMVKETAEVSDATSRDLLAIGYSGKSAKADGNRPTAIATKAGDKAVLPNDKTIRNFSYPMARKLYVYEVTGKRTTNQAEKNLMTNVTDRGFLDQILKAHGFTTLD